MPESMSMVLHRNYLINSFLKVFLIINHLLILSKYYAYDSRSSKVLSLEALLKSIMKLNKLEKPCQSDKRKRKQFTRKWKKIQQNL